MQERFLKVVSFFGFLLVCIMVYGIGAALQHMPVHDWVSKIKLASITRPDWVFAPVWFALDFLIGSQNLCLVAGKTL
jgi:tryptophan-rich sensory protein